MQMSRFGANQFELQDFFKDHKKTTRLHSSIIRIEIYIFGRLECDYFLGPFLRQF